MIKSKINKKCYIGSALSFAHRKYHHLYQLKRGIHHSIYLQRHVNKHGIESIEFEILEIVYPNELIEKEQYYIDLFTPDFNISKKAYSTMGVPCSDEKKENIRKALIGRKATPEAVEANRLGQLKRLPPTDETRKNISEGLMGRKVSVESRIKNLNSQKTRKEILCVTTGIKYPSLRAAEREMDIMHSSIKKVCIGLLKDTSGFVFKFI